ncbi:DUF1559 family PulG-like putative transporter [Zavarzinella formosa]|uniref:DUF1559 family PulG-like putative transporter n=1 Tax=Zavarzinella formosa TaxID=360055 RepID=UPI0003709902|nr:DUF1559 domain-containing protein [Zavarzinella formosa]
MSSHRLTARTGRRGFTLIELLVVMAIISILIGMLLPAVQKIRETANRLSSANNLKQQGLALHNFNDTNDRLPSNGTYGYYAVPQPPPNTSASWCYKILPYLEQDNRYANYMSNINSPIKMFQDPGRGTIGYATTGSSGGLSGTYNTYTGLPGTAIGATSDYAGNWNVLPDSTDRLSPYSVATIPDGTSNTIMAGTKSLSTDQYTPRTGSNWDESIAFGGSGGTGRGIFWSAGYWNNQACTIQKDGPGIDRSNAWGSPYAGGALFLFCDGSVRVIRHGADMIQFSYLLTPNGGEVNGSL